VPITHGPYTTEQAQGYAVGIARSEAQQRSNLPQETLDMPGEAGVERFEWQHQMFTRVTGCSVQTGSAYVGRGGFHKNLRALASVRRQGPRLPEGAAFAIAHHRMQDVYVKPTFGTGPALVVYVAAIVYCPTSP